MKNDTMSVALAFGAFAIVGVGTGYLAGSLMKFARNRNYLEVKKNLDIAKTFADVAELLNDISKVIAD